MFDKFGEFDSVEELNKAAAGLKEEGDTEALFQLAEENGIDREDAADYADGCTEELATLSMAAYGRLEVEEKQYRARDAQEYMILKVILMMLRGLLREDTVAAAVLKKGKRVSVIYDKLKAEAKKHQSGGCGVSCGTDQQLKEIIRAYYLDDKLEQKIAALYE